MNSPRLALLLVGSAKQPTSTSEALGSYFLERLSEQGYQIETLQIHHILRTDAGHNTLLSATDRANLVVLAFPTYIDSLPAPVTKALEIMAEHRRGQGDISQQFLAIANCGFPESQHNYTALEICRLFAREAGFSWAGGLALGGGEALNGLPLKEAGWKARNIVKALTVASQALAKDEVIPEEAFELMGKPIVPTWIYLLVGAFGWKQRARIFGSRANLQDRPFQREI